MSNEVAKLNVHTINKHLFQYMCVLTCIFCPSCSLQVALHEHTNLLFLQCVSVAHSLGPQRSSLSVALERTLVVVDANGWEYQLNDNKTHARLIVINVFDTQHMSSW